MIRRPPRPTLFPYPTLFRSSHSSSTSVPPHPDARLVVMAKYPAPGRVKTRLARTLGAELACRLYRAFVLDLADRLRALPYAVDRKSTRLNSSHSQISYAVFC